MTNITLTAQNVNGDPFLNGGNINITGNKTSVLTFVDIDTRLNMPLTGEYVSFNGGATLLSYQYLGVGNVRGDPMHKASFIRIDMGNGTFRTVALDMNADFDDLPNLPNGNTELTSATLDTTSANWFPGFACFAEDTLIDTAAGLRAIESLVAGDMIRTADHGLQPLLHLVSTRVRGIGALAPVRFAAGVLGNVRDLYVSQQHSMLVHGWRAQLFCGEDEMFVPARMMVNGRDITICAGGMIRYFHLLFRRHEVVYSEGIPTESFFSGAPFNSASNAAHLESALLFPHVASQVQDGIAMARRVAFSSEAKVLMAA